MLAATHGESLVEAFNTAADILDNICHATPHGPEVPPVAFEYNDKFGFVTADPSLLGTGMELEVRLKCPASVAAAGAAGRLAGLDVAQAALVDVVPSADGSGCAVRSAKTVGVTVQEVLGAVTAAAAALVEAAKAE